MRRTPTILIGQRVTAVMGNEAETLLAKRFAIVNVWRSTADRIEEWPLGLCAWDSVDAAHITGSVKHVTRPSIRQTDGSTFRR